MDTIIKLVAVASFLMASLPAEARHMPGRARLQKPQRYEGKGVDVPVDLGAGLGAPRLALTGGPKITTALHVAMGIPVFETDEALFVIGRGEFAGKWGQASATEWHHLYAGFGYEWLPNHYPWFWRISAGYSQVTDMEQGLLHGGELALELGLAFWYTQDDKGKRNGTFFLSAYSNVAYYGNHNFQSTPIGARLGFWFL